MFPRCRRTRLSFAAIILSFLLLAFVPTSHAQTGSLTIDDITVTCSQVDLEFSISGWPYGPNPVATIRVFADGSEIATDTATVITDGDTGSASASVPFPAQTAGTAIYVMVFIDDFDDDSAGPTPCSGGGGGGDDDDDSGTPGDGGESSEPPPAWGGYSDGRLNPDPAEYYTIYCHEGTDTVYVVRTNPQTETIKEIPLCDLVSLSVGGALDLGDFMTAVRGGEDQVTVYGTNGNLAPEPGSKSFSVAACLSSNGGAPHCTTAPPPGDDDSGAVEEPGPSPEELVQEDIDFCFDTYEFFGGGGGENTDLLVDCLVSATSQEGASGEQIVWVWVFQLCLGLPVAFGSVVFGAAGWRYRQRFARWRFWRR